jgi:nucleotide-binding universal stress UspA family protein
VDDDPVVESVLEALEWSLQLTEWDELIVLHVLPQHPLFLVGTDQPPMRRAQAFLDRIGERLEVLAVPVEQVIASGEPAQEIARVSDEREAELVVMGAHGDGGDFLMGSVSQKVVSLTDSDVLVVREPEDDSRDLKASFRALLAVDGSMGSEAGVEAFVRKTRSGSASIRLIHVVESIPSLWEIGRQDDLFSPAFTEQAQAILARALALLRRRGLEAECECRQGSPAGQILDVARRAGTDLIVVGSRGHSGIRNMVLGSITQRILRHAPCSVFCARGWAPEEGALSAGWSSDEWETQTGMA